MKFGKTYHEQNAARAEAWRQERERRSKEITRFAWLPTRMDNGESVWLESYYQQETYIECRSCWDGNGWWDMKRWAKWI